MTGAEWNDDLMRAGVFPAVQARSRVMRDRLIAEGLVIARKIPFDDISIIDICTAANCSIGAFYARFPDKLTLFKGIMVAAAAESAPLLEGVVRDNAFPDILSRLTQAQVERFREQEIFFRSAFKVSLDASEAWEPFRRNSHALAGAFIARALAEYSSDAAGVDEARIRFGFQIMYGVLNNAVMNRPGPYLLESEDFAPMLEQAMRAVMALPSKGE